MMDNMLEKLTDTFAHTVCAAPGKRLEYRDATEPSLALRVSGSLKTWVYRYRVKGVNIRRRMTIGRYPQCGIDRARKIARKVRKLADLGIDPRRSCASAAAIQLKKDRPMALPRIYRLPTPVNAGLYFLFLEKKLQYIGQSNDCFSRIKRHKGHIQFDEWRFLPAGIHDLDALEADYIRKHKPPLNRGLRGRRP